MPPDNVKKPAKPTKARDVALSNEKKSSINPTTDTTQGNSTETAKSVTNIPSTNASAYFDALKLEQQTRLLSISAESTLDTSNLSSNPDSNSYPDFLEKNDAIDTNPITGNSDNGYAVKRPTLKNIIENGAGWHNLPKIVYRYADFIYNKWYGIIPNNYMITLTRSNLPVNDEGLYSLAGPVVEDKSKDVQTGSFSAKVVAQAVTYLGKKTGNTLSNILNMTGGMNWEDANSTDNSKMGSMGSNSIGGSIKIDASSLTGVAKKISDTFSSGISGSNLATNVTGLLKGFGSDLVKDAGSAYITYKILRAFAKQYKNSKEVEVGTGGNVSARDALTIQQQQFDPYETGNIFARKSFGGVNKIRSTQKRKEGITFTNEFKLNFQYSLKNLAYSQRGKGTVNSKVAMLDIIGNLMALVMSNAEFYGGANRYKPSNYQFEFSTDIKETMLTATSTEILELLKKKLKSIVGSVISDIKQVRDVVTKTLSNSTLNQQITSEDITKADYENIFRLLFYEYFNSKKEKAGGDGAFNMINMQPTATPALLTGLNVGEWHVIVGNPFNPIARIGNLVCTGYNFKFPSDELGPDDFPTELEFTITLKPGRPRDRRGVTNMFGFIHKNKAGSTSTSLERTSSTRDSDIDDSPSKINLQEALRRSYFRPGELVGKNRNVVGANALKQNILEGGGLGAADFLSSSGTDSIAAPGQKSGITKRFDNIAALNALIETNPTNFEDPKAKTSADISAQNDLDYKRKEIEEGYTTEAGSEIGRFPNALLRLKKEEESATKTAEPGNNTTGTPRLPPNLFNSF